MHIGNCKEKSNYKLRNFYRAPLKQTLLDVCCWVLTTKCSLRPNVGCKVKCPDLKRAEFFNPREGENHNNYRFQLFGEYVKLLYVLCEHSSHIHHIYRGVLYQPVIIIVLWI